MKLNDFERPRLRVVVKHPVELYVSFKYNIQLTEIRLVLTDPHSQMTSVLLHDISIQTQFTSCHWTSDDCDARQEDIDQSSETTAPLPKNITMSCFLDHASLRRRCGAHPIVRQP